MSKLRAKPTHHVVIIRARGGGVVGAIDMMRYDSCSPATEQDSAKLERRLHTREETHLDGVKQPDPWVYFRRFVQDGAPKPPNVERWRSFGWECWPQPFDSIGEAESYAILEAREVKERAERAQKVKGGSAQ